MYDRTFFETNLGPWLGGGEADSLRSFGLRLRLNRNFVRLCQTEAHRILVFNLGGQHSSVGWSLVTISLHFHATSHPERLRLKIYLQKAKNWNPSRDSNSSLEYLHLPQAARRWGVPSQYKVLLLQPWLLLLLNIICKIVSNRTQHSRRFQDKSTWAANTTA